MKNQPIIVTGGAGFIGSNFVRVLLAQTKARVVVIDNLTYAGHLKNLDDVYDNPRFQFIKGDIGDHPHMRVVVDRVKPVAIVNLAAETHVDRSIDTPKAFIDTNIVGTFCLLEVTRKFLNDQPSRRAGFRFLHVSTDEVYGTLGKSGKFKETTPYAPNSPYSASKAAADHLVRAYHETFGVPVLITNCSNNYGPYQYPEKLIPLTLLNALEGKPLPVYGDGKNIRDWLYVTDHCEGILRALQKGKVGEKYNIGGLNEQTNIHVVKTLCRALDKWAPASENVALAKRKIVRYEDLIAFVPDRPGHDRRYAIDASKISNELGWKPRTKFKDGIEKTVRWYLSHLEWCSTVQRGTYHRERLGLTK